MARPHIQQCCHEQIKKCCNESNLLTAEWGEDCQVLMPSNIYRCKIGNRVRIGPFVEIQDDCSIGDDSIIQSHAFIAGGTFIGKRCFIGHGVITCNDKHPVANNKNWTRLNPTISDDVSVGSGAVILPEIYIGSGSVIAAGAVVVRDVPPMKLYISKDDIRAR